MLTKARLTGSAGRNQLIVLGWQIRVQWWNRIKATWMERVTTSEAPGRQPATANHPVSLQRFECVVRAAWMKSTLVTDEWAQDELVESNHPLCRFRW